MQRFAAARKPFGRVATIGRQGLHVPPEKVRKLLNLNQEIDYGKYCEDLLKAQFGAKSVDSFDNSDYEGATHIVDMNVRLKKQYRYDTVIDGGSLEHIYNAPQALKNLSEMCEEGGQILHMLPANNFCGHGFWQFSPELFFSLYSGKNGYGTNVNRDSFSADNISIRDLLQSAYGIKEDLISGVPGPLDSLHFDIQAKANDADVAAFNASTVDIP